MILFFSLKLFLLCLPHLKQTAAILFLLIHAINICGVQLFLSFAEKIADRQMIVSLDNNNYNESELVQLRLPLNIPYTTNWKDYERCDGNIVLNGIHYNYVKRIVYNDTMYLYCIPNQQKTEMSNTRNEYARQATDIPLNKKADQSAVKKSSGFNEYSLGSLLYDFSALMNSANRSPFFNNSKAVKGFINKPAQPPELIG